MKKNVFDLDENLELQIEKIYFNQGISNCNHSQIALDSRDNFFKCTKCFTKFLMNKRIIKNFRKRIITDFDFELAERNFKKEVKKLEFEEKE